jgi:Domain of unknown function (DUF5916)
LGDILMSKSILAQRSLSYSEQSLDSNTHLRLVPLIAALLGFGQVHSATIEISMLDAAPTIDGTVDPTEWSAAAVVDEYFVQFEPEFGAPSSFRTIVRIGQTDTALYVAFEAFDSDPSRLAAAVTQRDDDLDDDDSVAVLLDTFADGRTAYLFRTNVLATQQDGRIADNGRTDDLRWDATWRTAALRLDDRWTAEFEIPFSALKFASGSDMNWGINFVRTVPRRLEEAVWSGPAEDVFRVSAFGELQGITAPAPEDPWQWIPYVIGSLEDGEGGDVEAGIDVRWRPSSQLGVDLTVNPDFALIEADVEIINLSRFELRIPEKRPFFQEGNEMFAQRISQFYSRRIGDITWGAKSNGKIGRTDFSAIFASEDLDSPDASASGVANYGTLRLQHSLARGSNVGLLATNREFDGDNAGSVGVDTTFFFTDTLGMTAQFLQTHGPTADVGQAWFIRPSWDTSTSHFHVRYTEIDPGILDDFNAVGFLTEDDRKEFDTNVRHNFWFKNGPIERIRPRVNYNRYYSHEDVLRSWELDANIDVVFRNGWRTWLEYFDEYKLFEKEFRNDRTVLYVGWDGRDGRSVWVSHGTGVNFDNDLTLSGVSLKWPLGDHWRFSYDFTRLELEPELEEATTIHVFEVLYSFHADMYTKLFVQTNSAIEKENIQALWVWRFKPPFGSLQLAYQTGTSEQGQVSEQGDTFFAKLSWVF